MAQPKAKETPVYTLAWGDPSELPLTPGDLIHWRTLADRCYITIGQLNLPLGEGPVPEGQIDVRPVARYVLTPETVKVWATLFAQAANSFNASNDK